MYLYSFYKVNYVSCNNVNWIIGLYIRLLELNAFSRFTKLKINVFHMALTSRLCVFYVSQNRQRHLPYATLTDCVRITEVKSVYCAVRTDSLYKQMRFVFRELT